MLCLLALVVLSLQQKKIGQDDLVHGNLGYQLLSTCPGSGGSVYENCEFDARNSAIEFRQSVRIISCTFKNYCVMDRGICFQICDTVTALIDGCRFDSILCQGGSIHQQGSSSRVNITNTVANNITSLYHGGFVCFDGGSLVFYQVS